MNVKEKYLFLKAYITCIQREGRRVNEGECQYLWGLLDAIIDYGGKTTREQAAQKNNDAFKKHLLAYKGKRPTEREEYLLKTYNYEDRGEPVELLGSENSTRRVVGKKRVKRVERDSQGRVSAIIEEMR